MFPERTWEIIEFDNVTDFQFKDLNPSFEALLIMSIFKGLSKKAKKL